MVETKINPESKVAFYSKKSDYRLTKQESIPKVGTDHNKAPMHYQNLICFTETAPNQIYTANTLK
jgi:hypothetical protein